MLTSLDDPLLEDGGSLLKGMVLRDGLLAGIELFPGLDDEANGSIQYLDDHERGILGKEWFQRGDGRAIQEQDGHPLMLGPVGVACERRVGV